MAGKKNPAPLKGKAPEGFPAEVWELLKRMDARMVAIEEILATAVKDTATDVNNLKETVALLSAKIERQGIETKRMKDELENLKAHSMKENLIFSFNSKGDVGKETVGENCVGIIKDFLKTVMSIPDTDKFYIPVAHRLGGKNAGHRQIIAKFPVAQELDTVLKHTNRLRNTKHFVAKQLPPAMKERQQFAMEEFKLKRKDSGNKARLVNEKFFVRGKLQTKYLAASLPEPENNADDATIYEGEEIQDSGSIFRGYASTAKSIQDVKARINQLLKKPEVTGVSHIIYAYTVDDDSLGFRENFCSDGDYGMGFELLRLLRSQECKNTVCIVTRDCKPGFQHLGKKRFEHMTQTCSDALTGL